MKTTMPAHQPTSTRNTSITNTVGKAGTTTDRCAGKSWRLSANGSRRPIRGINSPSHRTVTVPSTSIWSKRISRPSRKSPVLSIKISTIITLEQTGPLRNGHARSCSTSVILPCRTTTTTATS